MASTCMSLPYVRPAGSPACAACVPDGRFAVKQAVCPPVASASSGRSSSRFPSYSLSVGMINFPSLYTRRILGYPSFAFNPSQYEPYTAEELAAKLSENQNVPFSSGSSNSRASSEEQSSEYKPFSVEELEQRVSQSSSFKASKQKHKTVSTTFQPLGPDYPPITLEELEAKIAESNYKPFSRFESKADASSSNPLGSEYKPFTVEELEQKIGESSYKSFSKQESKPFSPVSSAQSLVSDPELSTASKLEAKTSESLNSSSSIEGINPTESPLKPGDPSDQPFTAEELLQSSYDLGFRPFVEEEANQSSRVNSSSSSEESNVPSEPEFSGVEPPRLTKLYVGNVPWNFTNQDLDELFKQHGSVFVAEVVLDKVTGRSRGFGFVYMNSPEDAEVAIKNLDGQIVGGRPIKVSYQESVEERSQRLGRVGGDFGDITNNTNKLFVANLPWRVNDEALKDLFSDFGTVIQARVVCDRDTGRSKGFGFVTLSSADEVTKAISSLDGTDYQGRPLKVAMAGERPASRSF